MRYSAMNFLTEKRLSALDMLIARRLHKISDTPNNSPEPCPIVV